MSNDNKKRSVVGYFDLQRFGQYGVGGVASNLQSRDYKYVTDIIAEQDNCEYIVRRLTPLECCRLQGFPDEWCEGLTDDDPSEEEMAFWRWVFDEYADVTGGKPKTDRQIKTWLAKEPADSSIYRLWGNGVALPCVYDVLEGIADMVNLEDI